MSTIKKRNGIWQYRHNEYRISLKTRDYDVAKVLQKEYDIKRLTGKLDQKRIKVLYLCNQYLYSVSESERTYATKKKVTHQINMFIEYIRIHKADKYLEQITPDIFRRYADWRKIGSVKNDLMTLNGMFSWAHVRGLCDKVHVPVDEYKIKKSHKHRPISYDEFIQLYQSKHSLLYEWLYYTGLRPSDVVRIHGGMVNGRILTITPQKTAHSSGKEIQLYLHRRLAPPIGFLFGTYLEYPAQLDAARRDIKKILGKEVTLYSLRYSFNARMKEAGASLEVRKDAMGHTNITTTELYSLRDMSQISKYIDMIE